MKFKLLALTALMAASGANAAITTTAGGNSDMFATFYSASQSATYVVDLGLTISQFRAAVSPTATNYKLVWDLDGAGSFTATGLAAPLTTQTINYGDIFNTFATPAVTGSSDYRFGVYAGDGAPLTLPATGTRSVLVTSSLPAVTATNANVFNATAATGMDAYLKAQNEDKTNTTHTTASAGANMYDLGDSTQVLQSVNLGSQIKNTVTFNTVANVGNTLNFFALSNVGFGTVTQATVAKYNGVWSFDATQNQLVFATPVPEPETYAMLLAGLGLMGAIARRRKQK